LREEPAAAGKGHGCGGWGLELELELDYPIRRGSGACQLFLAALRDNKNVTDSRPEALRSRGPSGPTPRLSDDQLATVEQALLEGATANRFTGELWTLDRIAIVIERLAGVQHHPAHVWALLRHRLGWSVQRPKRRAVERDQADIDRWVKERWPRIKQTPNGAEPVWSSSTRARSA
jgi:transposase